MAQFYFFSVVLIAVFAAVFVAYYVYRLVQARRLLASRQRDRAAALSRLHVGATPKSGGLGEMRIPAAGGGVSVGRTTPAETAKRREGGPAGAEEVGTVQTHEQRTGLGQVSAEPVFIRRTKAGEVTVQIDARPAMPLRYILDVRMRSVLGRVAAQADADFGDSWAVLAEEDERGRLKLTRLA
ncbi:MAG: hypothetical protein Kow00129_13600 [Thermoleophilia bacterium]